MNKKRLVSMLLVSAMTAALFTGCGSDGNLTSGDGTTSAGTNSTTEEAGIKEFTAFFGVAGSEINDDNEVQQLIAEKVGAKVKETWLTGQTADEAVGTMIAGGEYPDFIEGQTGTTQLYEAGALVALDDYLALFNNYIPDFLGGGEGFNRTCFVVGIIVCIVYVALVMKNRADRAKKGYSVESFGGVAVKMVLICVVVLAFMFRLAQYKGIPNSLLWVAVIIAIYTYIASKTTTGRYFYAVGGNEKATKLSGIDTNKVYFLAYLNMGLLAAIAGMVTMARLNSSNPQAGTNFEMDAIGACFIGGLAASVGAEHSVYKS